MLRTAGQPPPSNTALPLTTSREIGGILSVILCGARGT